MPGRLDIHLRIVLMLAMAAIICSCGKNDAAGTAARGITVSGKVSANAVYPGTVRVYGLYADGTLKTPALAEGHTEKDGSYAVSIADYQGAIVAMAFGRYTDEATHTVIDIPEGKSLYAALPAAALNGKSSVPLHITPLSELAYLKARASGNVADMIAESTAAISRLFGVDIAAVPPLPYDAALFANGSATGDQIRLGTLLATVSQLTANGSADPQAPAAADLQNTLQRLAAGITMTDGTARLSSDLAYLIQQAASGLATNSNVLPVVTAGGNAAQTMVHALESLGAGDGARMARFRLRTVGDYKGKICGITAVVSIPAGLLLKTDSEGVLSSGVIVASGVAGADSRTEGKLTGTVLKIGLINAMGFGAGEFATIFGEYSAASVLLPGAFAPVTDYKIADELGNPVTMAVEVF